MTVDRKCLKSDSCEAESCFPGYRIIETTANGSGLLLVNFADIIVFIIVCLEVEV